MSGPVRFRAGGWRLLAAIGLLAAFALYAGLRYDPGAAATRTEAQPPLPTVTLEIDGHRLVAEVARTAEQRYMGLSFRERLDDDAGMLFVYADARPRAFTMRNTLIPLSIAFIDASRRLIEVIDMDVGPGQIFPSSAPAMYALEVDQGWFDRHGIGPGARMRVPNPDDLAKLADADR